MYTGTIGLDETFQHLVTKKTQSSLRERKGGRVVKYHLKDFFEEKWRSQIDEITHFLEIANIRVQVYSTGPGVEMQIDRWTFSCTRVTRQDGSLKIMIRHPGKKIDKPKEFEKKTKNRKKRWLTMSLTGPPADVGQSMWDFSDLGRCWRDLWNCGCGEWRSFGRGRDLSTDCWRETHSANRD